MAKSETLRDMLIVKLKALYDIETELLDALPKMAEAATEPSLKEAFTSHLEETRGQLARLESAFALLGEKKEKEKVEGIRGMIKDAEWLIKNTAEGAALDTALVGAAQAVEHYEMALYAAGQEWAEKLGSEEVAALLKETEAEEANAAMKLGNLGAETVGGVSAG
jgi:ferritin-like metal-binding protein YciE